MVVVPCFQGLPKGQKDEGQSKSEGMIFHGVAAMEIKALILGLTRWNSFAGRTRNMPLMMEWVDVTGERFSNNLVLCYIGFCMSQQALLIELRSTWGTRAAEPTEQSIMWCWLRCTCCYILLPVAASGCSSRAAPCWAHDSNPVARQPGHE